MNKLISIDSPHPLSMTELYIMSHPPVSQSTATSTASPKIIPSVILRPLCRTSPSFLAVMNPIISMNTNKITMQTARKGISLTTTSLANGNAMNINPITKLTIALICLFSSPSSFVFSSIAKNRVNTSKKGSIRSLNQGFENIVSTIFFYEYLCLSIPFFCFYSSISSSGSSSVSSSIGRLALLIKQMSPIALTNWCGTTTPLAPPKKLPIPPATFILQLSTLFSTTFTSSTSPKKSPWSVYTLFPMTSDNFFIFIGIGVKNKNPLYTFLWLRRGFTLSL